MIVCGWRRIGACLGLLAAGSAPAADLSDELAAALALQSAAAESQARIDTLDDETRQMRAERLNLADAEAAWREAGDGLAARLEIQNEQVAALAARVVDAERTAEQILPLMAVMIDTLEQFVALDIPFDSEARLAALHALQQMLVRPDVSIAEKFARVMDAYRRELAYGYDIEASRGRAPETGRFVDLLRLGRTAYYFRSLDGRQAGVWDSGTRSWVALDETRAARVGHALAVVRGESEPSFLTLPVVMPDEQP